MYEYIKVGVLSEKLDNDTIKILHEKCPGINSSHTIKELLQQLDTVTVGELLARSLKINYATLAVLTVETLIDYEKYHSPYRIHRTKNDADCIKDIVVRKIQDAFDNYQITKGSDLVDVLGFTLFDKCNSIDYLLAKYGQQLSKGAIFMGPEDWLVGFDHPKSFPIIIRQTPWAKALLD